MTETGVELATGPAEAQVVVSPAAFYSPPASAAKNGSICQNCGTAGPVTEPRCFPNHATDSRTHVFIHPDAGKKEGAKGEETKEGSSKEKEEPKCWWCFWPPHFRLPWKLFWVVFYLVCYGMAIAYTVIPILNFLNQTPQTSISVSDATAAKPIPFPALQICNVNFAANLTGIVVLFNDTVKQQVHELPMVPTDFTDYDYEAHCFEINNNLTGALLFSAKSQQVVIMATVPEPFAYSVQNNDEFLCNGDNGGVCDPTQSENATLTFVFYPQSQALGIAIGIFQPTGTPLSTFNGSLYVPAGSYTQTYLRLLENYDYDAPLQTSYTFSSSSVPNIQNSWFQNPRANGGNSTKMSQVVFLTMQFADLAYQINTASKSYKAFNAFGDATAIVGFFTGFGVFAGGTFHEFVMKTREYKWFDNWWYDPKEGPPPAE